MTAKNKPDLAMGDHAGEAVDMDVLSRPHHLSEKLNVYYSSSVEGNIGEMLGAPHYSYRFAESKFLAVLTSRGVRAHKLLMPEYYSTTASLPRTVHKVGQANVHMIFRSTEQFRLLKFAWNICCFAWEFDVLKDDTEIDEHPFLNQKRMLNLCNEIWVPCRYTKSVLDSYAVAKTHVIPAPIAIPKNRRASIVEALPFLGHIFVAPLHYNFLRSQAQNRAKCGEGSATLVEYVGARLKRSENLRIYLTILNPEDFRKNLDAMLRAFHIFSSANNENLLIVKVLTSSNRFHLLDVLSDVIPKKLESGSAIASKNIVFFSEFLSEAEMDKLYSIADFYLCASLCEGQNLPLLESMARGVVPITTANTAMADYITTANAVVIKDQLLPNDCPHLAGTIARRPFSIHRSRVEDIYDALATSASISPTAYSTMSSKAREIVKQRYSEEAVWSKVESRLAAISSAQARGFIA